MFGSPCNITTGLGSTMGTSGVIDFSSRRFTYYGKVWSKGLELFGTKLLGLFYMGNVGNSSSGVAPLMVVTTMVVGVSACVWDFMFFIGEHFLWDKSSKVIKKVIKVVADAHTS